MSSTTKLQLNKINEHNHNRAFGAKEGVPNEDFNCEYEKILQNKNIKIIEDKKYWVGRTLMSTFLIIA